MRMRSSEAAGRFANGSIDFVHLDGNHQEDQAVADVMAFLPKVRNGGLLLINDANWPCVRKALVLLLERTRVLSPYRPCSAWMLFARDLAREQRAASLMTT
jgi:hypothetical protein